MNNKITIQKIAILGVFIALVFVSSMISIPNPTPVGSSRIHLGNIFCLLSGFILGPIYGGLAAGFGSMFYDFTNPLFIAESPITFVMKFAMAYVCGKIAYSGNNQGLNHKVNITAAISGAVFYMFLYLTKSFIFNIAFLNVEIQTALIDIGAKAISSSVNAIAAVVLSLPLALAVRKAMEKAKVTV